MNDPSTNTNMFLSETINFFDLTQEEKPFKLDCTEHLILLIDKLFICRFLHDCIEKGIDYHKTLLERDSTKIAPKIDPDEAGKIIFNFKEIIKNKDLISILAYEFYINYLDGIIRDVLHKNTNPLKGVKDPNYKSFELVERIEKDPSIILEELINIMISGDRDDGNLRTKSEFWIKLLEDSLKFNLEDGCKDFWETFNIRRNASSHRNAKLKWGELNTSISHTELPLWMYGLILLAYKIDNSLNKTYNLGSKEIEYNFSGKPIYNLKDVKT